MVKKLSGFNDPIISFKFYYLTNLAKRLPTSIPSIGSRLILYKQIGVSRSAIINCIALESLLIGLGGSITFISFLPFYSQVPNDFTLPLAVGTLLLLGLLFIKPQILITISNWFLRKTHRQLLTASPNRTDLIFWTGIYIAPWIFSGIGLYLLPLSLSSIQFPSTIDAIGISTLATLITLLNIFLPGGLGLKEFAVSFLLTPYVPLSIGLVISIVWRILNTLIDIFWTLTSILIYSLHEKKNKR